MAQTHPAPVSSSTASWSTAAYGALQFHSAVMERRNQRRQHNLVAGMASALIALGLGAALGVTLLHMGATAETASAADAVPIVAMQESDAPTSALD